MTTNKQEHLPSKASKCDGSKATAVCKHCGLTLQGTDKEGEDICVDCLTDLCFPQPNNNYSIIEGMIRQATNNPIKRTENYDTTEKTRNKPDQDGR
jgi:hypothetical protein